MAKLWYGDRLLIGGNSNRGNQ